MFRCIESYHDTIQNSRFLGRFHRHHHIRLKQSNKNPTEEDSSSKKQIFDAEIHGLLSKLQISHLPGQAFLTVSWLNDAMKLVQFACEEISHVLPKISCSDKEKSLLEVNLEDTLKLLDVCNGLKEALNDVQHYVMLVRYAVWSAAGANNESIEDFKAKATHLHSALMKATDFLHSRAEVNLRHNEGRSKLETCRSLLRRMDKPWVDASGKETVPHKLFYDMHGVKVLAIFVCGVLSIALSVKPKRPLSCVEMSEEPTWLASLQLLQGDVKRITDDAINHDKVTILKEFEEVISHTNQLFEQSKLLLHEASPSNGDKLNFTHQYEKLSAESDALHKGLQQLQQHINGLFRMLVAIRVDFLEVLCHG